tara:strand:- start:402 stop:2057 length:1656 start_codon:yes stop_codon:yes gene_type:complete
VINLSKFFFGTVALFCLLIFITSFFVDKKKFVDLIEQQIKQEFGADISFNDDVSLHFVPFPSVKINSLKYINKNLDLYVEKLNISLTWSSVLSLKPEINNLELYSPFLRWDSNLKFSEKFLVRVNSKNNKFSRKLNQISKKFDLIKIYDGKAEIKNLKIEKINSFNAVVRGKDNLRANGDFFLVNLNSSLRFDFSQKNPNEFNLIMQQKINEKNKIDFIGKIDIFDNDFSLSGDVQSDLLNLDELLVFNKSLSLLKNNKIIPIKSNIKAEKKINFFIKKLLLKNLTFNDTQFILLIANPTYNISNFRSRFDESIITGKSIIFSETKKVIGNLYFKEFLVKESYFGNTKYDLFDGKFNCKVDFKYFIGKYKNNFKSLNSSGNCKSKNIKLKGINLEEIAKNLDNIGDFSTLIKTINPKKWTGVSTLNKIDINFQTKNGVVSFQNTSANHSNLDLEVSGNYRILDDKINFRNKAYFKTKKFEKLPPLGILIKGSTKDYDINYDYQNLKQKLFNEGVKKILNEKKSITINPDEIRKLFDQKKIDPNKIIDLFVN